jgi:hypothetical protein
MAIAFVKSAKGSAATSSVAWGFGSATTSGNLIVGAIAADDYNGTPTTGWTQSAEMEQQAFHGGYIWWRISTGETNPQAYTIGSATNSAWILAEFSGIDATPYDTSQGVFTNTSGGTYSTDVITPTTGERLLVAMLGASDDQNMSTFTVGSWTNSFTGIDSSGSGGGAGTNDLLGLAYRLVTGDGVTTFSTAGTYSDSGAQSRSALIIAFKAAAVGGTSILRQMMMNH